MIDLTRWVTIIGVSSTARDPVTREPGQAPRRRRFPTVIVATIILLGLAGGWLWWLNRTDPDTAKAIKMCQQQIRGEVERGFTAKFSNTDAISSDGFTYHIAGYVDTQNTYGAAMRAMYACDVWHPATGSWRVNEVHVFPLR